MKTTSSTMLALQSTSSVQFSHSVVSDSLWSHVLQHASFPCPSSTPEVCSNSCPSENVIIIHYELCVWDILCVISKILGQIWTKWNMRLFSVLDNVVSVLDNVVLIVTIWNCFLSLSWVLYMSFFVVIWFWLSLVWGSVACKAGIKVRKRNINNLRYTDDTTLMAESKE